MPVGSALILSGGKYTPELTLANFSNSDARVHVTYSHMAGERPLVQELATFTVPFNTTKHLSFRDLVGDADLRNSFLVKSDAPSGDVVSKLVATSESQGNEVELLGKDAEDHVNGGLHPWSLEQGNESSVLLFNHSTKLQTFNLQIGNGKTLWTKGYELLPMETKNISLSKLIHSGAKDDKGRKLPASLQSGEVEWFVPKNLDVGHGRLLQSNRATLMARSFSCGQYYVICGVYLTQDISSLPVDITQEFGYLTVNVCSNPNTPSTCSGSQAFQNADGETMSWSSSNSDAEISGPSYNSSVNVFGNAAGTSTITGTARDQYGCGGSPNGNVSVNAPHHLIVWRDITSVVCTSNTVKRQITYLEVDVNGHQVGTISTKEQFASKGSNSCHTTIQTSETCSPDAGGQLIDQIFVGCNSVGGSCGTTYTKQQWLYCPSSGSPVVFATPGDLYIHNNSVLVGGSPQFPAGTKIGPNGIIP